MMMSMVMVGLTDIASPPHVYSAVIHRIERKMLNGVTSDEKALLGLL
jgi:hypothetical protein